MTLKEYYSRKDTIESKSFLVTYLTKTLISAILVFIMLILVNISDKVKEFTKEEILTTNLNFANINSFYNKHLTSIFKPEEKPVYNETEESEYEKYKDGVKVKNTSETVNLLNSGIVIYIGEKENYGNTIIIQQSDGTDAWYAGLKSTNVKLYDYVEKGTVLGSKKEYYYLLFQKEGVFLDYEEVFK